MAVAEPLALATPSGHAVAACCRAHPNGTCPDHYARSLEPRDETIAELQSIIVAMRHRDALDDAATLALEHDLELYLQQLHHIARLPEPQTPPRSVQLIRLTMALAATAIRYREEL